MLSMFWNPKSGDWERDDRGRSSETMSCRMRAPFCAVSRRGWWTTETANGIVSAATRGGREEDGSGKGRSNSQC